MMSLGVIILELVAPLLELLAPYMPGDTFPSFFKLEMAQRSLIAAVMVTIVAGYLGLFLIMKNQALMGDGLAHVSFGGNCTRSCSWSIEPTMVCPVICSNLSLIHI